MTKRGECGRKEPLLFDIPGIFGILDSDFVIGRDGGGRIHRRSIIHHLLSLSLRNRVISTASPGMATADTANSQPRSPERAVPFDGFEKILRAGGLEPAAGIGSAQFVQDRGNELLITADEKPENPFHGGS
jgi:hypothetical protein